MYDRPEKRVLPELIDIFGRGLRLLCPCCAHGRLFKTLFQLNDQCAACGERFEREPGQWFGAVYVNILLTCVLTFAGFTIMRTFTSMAMTHQLWIWIPVAVLAPVALHRHSHGLWASIVFLGEGLYIPWPNR